MESFWQQVGLELPELAQAVRVVVRLGAAVVFGGVVGLERERLGKVAGLRTHMLVALGAALFTVVPLEATGGKGDVTELVKGIAAGVGFLGAGTVFRVREPASGRGPATAATGG